MCTLQMRKPVMKHFNHNILQLVSQKGEGQAELHQYECELDEH